MPDEEETTDPQTPSAKLRAAAATSVELIDVSADQAPSSIDWARVRGAGVVGVIVKATDGLGSPDKAFAAHVKGARAAGLLVGAYHYLHMRAPPRPQDVVQQAAEFSALYLDAGCELAPAVDVEPDDNPVGLAGSAWLSATFDCAEEITMRVVGRPLIYSYPDFWLSLQPTLAPELEIYRSWVAWYGQSPIVLPPWGRCDLWQYSGGGSVPGVAGKVDRSRSLGPIGGLLRAPPASEQPTRPDLST